MANIVSPLFGGLPATGAIARTATNIRSGAQTPVAGFIHALTLVGILLVAAPLAQHVPLSVLAAILLVVAYNMGDWGEIPELLRLTRTDIAVWLVTFALTVFADLTQAVGVGMVCAALLFIKRVADTTTVSAVTDEYVQDGHMHNLQNQTIPPYVRIFRIHGPFLFGATDKLRSVLDDGAALPPIVILRMRNMTALDATGLRAIEELAEALHASGRTLILCGARHQPERLIARADFHRHIGDANICVNVTAALDRAGKSIVLAKESRHGPQRESSMGHHPTPSPQLQTMKAEFFRALAHPIRIRLLEVMVTTPESSVQDLQRTLGIDQPIVSQQLARLRASGIVATKNSGAATRYSVTDPLIKDLLQVAKQILNRRLAGVQSLLRELDRDASRARVRPPRTNSLGR